MKYDHDAVLERWKRGDDGGRIATAFGMAGSEAVRNIVNRARAKGDKRAISHNRKVQEMQRAVKRYGGQIGRKLHREGDIRGLSVDDLVDRLVRVTVADDLFKALLDDGVGA